MNMPKGNEEKYFTAIEKIEEQEEVIVPTKYQ